VVKKPIHEWALALIYRLLIMRNSFVPTAPYLYTFVLKILSSPIHSELKLIYIKQNSNFSNKPAFTLPQALACGKNPHS